MILKKQAVDIITGARVTEIEQEEGQLKVSYMEKETAKSVLGEVVLVAVGRRPYLMGLFDEAMPEDSLPETHRGALVVDETYGTSVPGIYGIGDAIGGIQLAHVASAEGERAVAAMLHKPMPISMAAVPSCVYTTPEIATVGMTQEEAKEKGIDAVQLKYAMSANGKTVLTRQERSFLKILAEKETGKILGAHMMCDRATDMIGEFSSAIVNGYTAEDMAKAIRPHPTFNEAVGETLRLFEKE